MNEIFEELIDKIDIIKIELEELSILSNLDEYDKEGEGIYK